MGETIFKARDEEMLERGIAVGKAEGKAEGLVEACRENLRLLLEERFGPLSAEMIELIEKIDDLERLRAALRQVLHIQSLAELRL